MNSPFAQIPELANLNSFQNLVRIPNEQNVPFSDRIREVVDTPEYQRLGQISQLGLVARVYPGARHTRLEHSLGVYHNALRYLQQLQNDPRFVERVTPREAERLILAALLHDVGHWPFCHPIEDLGLWGISHHEQQAAEFLQPGSPLANVLERHWGIAGEEVRSLIDDLFKKPSNRLIKSILSGPIDVDKMDYLERDSLHCGVPYGRNFDKQRLIQSLVTNQAGDGLAITSKGKTAAELMVFARYVMFSEVYWHHTVRAVTSMFARAFFELRDRLDMATLFRSTDAEMSMSLRNAAKNHPVEKILDSVFGVHREFYKCAAEFSFDPQEAGQEKNSVYHQLARRTYTDLVDVSRRLSERLSKALQKTIAEVEVLIDAPPPHREVEFKIDVALPKEGRYRPLTEVSPVVQALAKNQFDDWVKRVRLFVSPQFASEVAGLASLNDFILDAAR